MECPTKHGVYTYRHRLAFSGSAQQFVHAAQTVASVSIDSEPLTLSGYIKNMTVTNKYTGPNMPSDHTI